MYLVVRPLGKSLARVSGSCSVRCTTSGLSIQAFLSSSCHVQVMPYSTGLSTPLANFEANQNYKDTVDPSVMVSPSPSSAERTSTPLHWGIPRRWCCYLQGLHFDPLVLLGCCNGLAICAGGIFH